MEIKELVFSEEDVLSGVDAISIVSHPAIEENFVKLTAQKEVELRTLDKEKRILLGPALIPNKMIYRKNEEDEFYIYFSRDTVSNVSQAFLKKGNQNKSTLEHQANLEGLTVVESWIVEDSAKDKSAYYNLEMPVGTWMVAMKVYNDKVWDDYVQTGKVKGFSIEGYFADSIEASDQQKLEKVRSIIKDDGRTKSGKKIVMESFSDYPDSVKNNAMRGIKLNEKQNNSCGTRAGKIRAQQLADGEPVSLDTVKRMKSYLSRAAEYYDEGDTEACGTISYLLWGGKSALRWAESKIKEIEETEAKSQLSSLRNFFNPENEK